jgi:hypothetical protein
MEIVGNRTKDLAPITVAYGTYVSLDRLGPKEGGSVKLTIGDRFRTP